jgi:hypothetical protein
MIPKRWPERNRRRTTASGGRHVWLFTIFDGELQRIAHRNNLRRLAGSVRCCSPVINLMSASCKQLDLIYEQKRVVNGKTLPSDVW